MHFGAVITADIVNSTKLSSTDLNKLITNLKSILKNFVYEFYRGDSFQIYVHSVKDALILVLKMRSAAIGLNINSYRSICDVRASIGIGHIPLPIKVLNSNLSDAFIFSGRAFDKLKSNHRLAINCNEQFVTAGLGLTVISRFLDFLFNQLTPKQAVVVNELLLHKTQIEAARKLKKSQATVNKHAKSAGWQEIEELIQSYSLLIQSIDIK